MVVVSPPLSVVFSLKEKTMKNKEKMNKNE